MTKSSPAIDRFLDKACFELGFCLLRDAKSRVAAIELCEAEKIVDAVLREEGLDPRFYKEHRRSLLALYREFGA